MEKAYVIKAVSDDVPGYSIPRVWEALLEGKARIGWSYRDHLDLRKIQQKVRTKQPLDQDENDAWRCRAFLEELSRDDYLLYPHQPRYGFFAIAKVRSDYEYGDLADSLDGDFRSYRRCDLLTREELSWRDAIVPPMLKRKLGLRGRMYQLYEVEFVREVVQRLPQRGQLEDESNEARLGRIAEELAKVLPRLLHTQFPTHDLSRRLCKDLFERMGYSVSVQEGASEAGSDLVVTVGSPLIRKELRVGVQAFSYDGEIRAEALQPKLQELLAGWEKNTLDHGVLLTTGICGAEAVALIERYNHAAGPPVTLIDGRILSDLFLQYFGDSLQTRGISGE